MMYYIVYFFGLVVIAKTGTPVGLRIVYVCLYVYIYIYIYYIGTWRHGDCVLGTQNLGPKPKVLSAAVLRTDGCRKAKTPTTTSRPTS